MFSTASPEEPIIFAQAGENNLQKKKSTMLPQATTILLIS